MDASTFKNKRLWKPRKPLGHQNLTENDKNISNYI